MKKKNLLISVAIVLGLVFGAGIANSQTLTFGDVASNYETSTWIDGSNNGSGFGPWQISSEGASAGTFVWSSTENGHGDINTNEMAFGMWSNNAGTISATRQLAEWGDEHSLSIQLAVQWQIGRASCRERV